VLRPYLDHQQSEGRALQTHGAVYLHKPTETPAAAAAAAATADGLQGPFMLCLQDIHPEGREQWKSHGAEARETTWTPPTN